jgi:hypothetical protein
MVPLESKYHIADFMEFSAAWDQNTRAFLPYKRKRFFAWQYREPKLGKTPEFGFKCPDHRHDVAMIGYYGWNDVSLYTPVERSAYDIEGRTSGWILYGDNHDSRGDHLFAALWFAIIKDLKGVEVWTRHPFERENNYMFSETENISHRDVVFTFLREIIKNLTPETNPLSQPRAALISEPTEQIYNALPSISLEIVHEEEYLLQRE